MLYDSDRLLGGRMKYLIISGLLLTTVSSFASDKVIVGGRLQGVLANNSENETQDIYLRRTRLNLTYTPWEGHKFNYDIRNDKANLGDKGEGQFVIGDAYWQIDINKYSIKNVRMFRAKVDVSYTQTASSKDLFSPTRAFVSEYASDYVVSNRRANNIQINGNIKNLAYQVAISDGVDSDEVDIAEGSTRSISGIEGQKLTYGAKIRYYFFGDALKNKTNETFYGNNDTFSLGVGFFQNDKIIFKLSDDSLFTTRRALTNVELSYAKGGLRLLGEYFTFDNDIVNLEAANKEDRMDTSSGHYILAEYVMGKWAPNIGVESFDQSYDDMDINKNSCLAGINYYLNQNKMRLGFVYKSTTDKLGAAESESEAYQLYAMLNF